MFCSRWRSNIKNENVRTFKSFFHSRAFSHSRHSGNSESSKTSPFLSIAFFLGMSVFSMTTPTCELDDDCGVSYDSSSTLTNWSSTHSCSPMRIYEPKSAQEVVRVLQLYDAKGGKVRPVGTALSPNGIGMSTNDTDSLLSLALIDHVDVNPAKLQVTVGAGARVSKVLSELKKHDLTLQNFSSIQEQQIGGWTQVAAHGTGCSLPTVDEMIVKMQVATPNDGLMTLSGKSNPFLFNFTKVGLGSLGVVTELTLQCMPKMKLFEHTYTVDKSEISKGHSERLKKFRHVRYMWLPYTDTVVVVVSNPATKGDEGKIKSSKSTNESPTLPLANLVRTIKPDMPSAKVANLSFSQLRDVLLDHAPLDLAHVKRVNVAEAEFWKRSEGHRLDDSTNILGFDCGGEQWVLEVAFPMGSLDAATGKDVEFVKRLLAIVEAAGIPAPSPIEQRWTARSTSPMSPAFSTNPDEVFSWVGIIMYLPPNQTPQQRDDITRKFGEYQRLLQPLMDEFNAHPHWAKVELPEGGGNAEALTQLRARMAGRYPVEAFNAVRAAVDPKSILSNRLVDQLFGQAKP